MRVAGTEAWVFWPLVLSGLALRLFGLFLLA